MVVAVAVAALAAWSLPLPVPIDDGSVLGELASAAFPTPIRHVFVLMFENAEIGQVFQNGSYERYLASHFAEAGQYYSLEHYSLPNYLAVTGGTPENAFFVEKTKNLGDLLTTANETWKGEEQSMPVPCDGNNTALYDIEHNPWLLYSDIVRAPARCDQHVVNFTALDSSIATGLNFPNYNLIVPNRQNDGHDTNVSFADAWLRSFLAPIINSSIFRSSVFFITYDEGTSNLGANGSAGGGHVYFVAVSPYARPGYDSTVPYSDYNLLTTTEWLLGLGHLGKNDNWTMNPPMKGLFNFSRPAKGAPVALGSPRSDAGSPLPELARVH